jgi:hypothetical protein
MMPRMKIVSRLDRASMLRFKVTQRLGPDAQDRKEQEYESQQELALNGRSALPRASLAERMATEGRLD